MKTTTRILIALLLVLSLLCAFCLFVSAEGEDENAPEPEIAVSEENGASEEVETKTFGDVVSGFISDHRGELLSVASLILTGILAYLWKKRLLPSVGNSLSQINGAVTLTTAALADKSDAMSQTLLEFLKKIEPYLPMLKDLAESLQSVKAEKDAQLIINRETVNLLCLMVETARFPDSVKEQARLYKTECDKAMMENEGSGDSE